MFAILGLRSIYIVLERLLPMFRYLERAISIILIFIGVKILIKFFGIHLSEGISLSIVLTLLISSIVLSRVIPEKKEDEHEKKSDAKDDDKKDEASPSA
jgi:tellurite resistance protein TerC